MAKLCVEGMAATYKYCDKYNLPYKKVGKLVVATNDLEEERLLALWERASQNGVPDLELVDRQGIKDREPACEGVRAIWSPHTGSHTDVVESSERTNGGGGDERTELLLAATFLLMVILRWYWQNDVANKSTMFAHIPSYFAYSMIITSFPHWIIYILWNY